MLCVLLLRWISPAVAGECAPGKVVNFAGVNWESGAFITAVLREVLERGFDCHTETVPGNSVTLEQALANDDVQIFAEEWVGRSDIWKKAESQNKVRAIGHPFTDATEGWYVPDYVVKGDAARDIVASAPDLRSVAQLADQKYIALFKDPEQPERGRFLNCPSGWTCEGVNSAKLQAYGLQDRYVDFRPGTGPAMDAAITAAYQQGRPLLFYYWSPSSLVGKLKLARLEEPPFSPACWADLTSARGTHRQGCAAPEADVAYGVSAPFANSAPGIMAFLQRATFPTDELNANLVAIADSQIASTTQAIAFLRNRGEIWRPWVSPAVAERIETSFGAPRPPLAVAAFPADWVISIRQPVNDAVARLVKNHGEGFRTVSHAVLGVVVGLDHGLDRLPWWLLIGTLMALAWAGTRRAGLTVAVGVLLFFLGMLGLWNLMLQTLTLVLLSSTATLAIGLAVGILSAKSHTTKAVLLPILDIMQTMPGFVYLIPVLMLFGLGKVPAILATIIYSLPPMIRLTALGIEQVDPDIKEAAEAFGIAPLRMLLTVELPLARPTLMAGVNQSIMLALSMVVVASMIGARGLGEQVLNGIQTLDIGLGLEAGVGIVILAFVLDRITQGFGARHAG